MHSFAIPSLEGHQQVPLGSEHPLELDPNVLKVLGTRVDDRVPTDDASQGSVGYRRSAECSLHELDIRAGVPGHGEQRAGHVDADHVYGASYR